MEEWSERYNIAGFEHRERGSQANECEQPLEAGKGEKTGLSLQPVEGTQPCRPLDVSPMRPTMDF